MSYNIKMCNFLEAQLEDFLDELEILGKKENTIKSYSQTIKSFIDFLNQSRNKFDLQDSGSIKSSLIKFLKYKNDTLEKHNEDIKNSSKILYMTHLKRFFSNIEIATGENYRTKEIFGVINIKKPQRIARNHKKQDVEKLLEKLEENKKNALDFNEGKSRAKNTQETKRKKIFIAYRDSMIIKIYLYCGIRASEILNLKVSSFEEHEELFIFTIIGKGDKKRKCYLLKKYITDEVEFFKEHHYNEIAISVNNRKLDRVQIWKMIEKRFKESSVNASGVHKFRHLFAKEIYEKTKNIVTVQKILGHSSIATTSIYTEEEEETTAKNYLDAMR